MALQERIVPIDLTGGVDTKSDPILVPEGKLTRLENATLKTAALGPRPGYDKLTTTVLSQFGTYSGSAAPTTGSALAARNGTELCLFSKQELYSYSSATGGLAEVGFPSAVALMKTSLLRNRNLSAGNVSIDQATLNGFTLICWDQDLAPTTLLSFYAIYDETAKQWAVPPTAYGSGTNVQRYAKAGVINGMLCMVYLDAASGYIKTFGAAPTFTVTSTNLGSTAITDVVFNGTVAYGASPGANCSFISFNSAGTVLSTGTPTGFTMGVVNGGFSLCLTGDNKLLAFFSGSTAGLQFCAYTTAFVQVGSTQVVDGTTPGTRAHDKIAAIAGATSATVYYSVVTNPGSPVPQPYESINYAVCSSSSTVTTAQSIFATAVSLASVPFTIGGNTYLLAKRTAALQSTSYVLEDVTASVGHTIAGEPVSRVVAKAQQNTGVDYSLTQRVPQVVSTTTTSGYALSFEQDRLIISNASVAFGPMGITRLGLDFDRASALQTADVNGCLYLAGGVLSHYDGNYVTEALFHNYPEGLKVAVSGAGTAVTNTSVHQYCYLYEWTDALGNRHQSTPSIPVSLTNSAGSTQNVTVTMQYLQQTQKTGFVNSVNLVPYRTVDAGTTFYRLSSPSSTISNVVNTNTVAFSDTVTDAAIIANEPLYTTGGVLSAIAPPSCKYICVHGGRVFLAGMEDPYEIWYSEPIVKGAGLVFNDLVLFFRVPSTGGVVTAIASMDEKFIIFAKTKIFYVLGGGPNNIGQQNTFTDPIPVMTDVGCIDWRTVVVTPMGIVFQSQKGFYLLDRGLNLKYIGAAVEKYTTGSSPQTISAAVLSESTQEIRYLSSSGTTTTSLVYNYFYDQWATFLNYDAVDALSFGDVFYMLDSSGRLLKESATSYRDVRASTAVVPMLFETGWIKPSAMSGQPALSQAFQRVWRVLLIGQHNSASTVLIEVGFDYNPIYAYSSRIADTSTLFNVGDPFQIREHVHAGDPMLLPMFPFHAGAAYGGQKCEAIRFRVTVTPIASPWSGLSFSNLSLSLGVKKGAFKLPASKSIT